MNKNKIQFNHNLKLILSDVDETIADVYKNAEPEMIHELSQLLSEGILLFLVSGGGLTSIRQRIVDFIEPKLRARIIIAHCHGAEVWGFDMEGELREKPFFGVYEEHFTQDQKKLWRKIVAEIIDRFHLEVFPPQPRDDFITKSQSNPLSIMLADRGPQIAFECTNSIDLTHAQKRAIEKELDIVIPKHHNSYDLRVPLMEACEKLYKKHALPIHVQMGGIFSVDHVINGVDKTKAIHSVLLDENILSLYGLKRSSIDDDAEIEIWGDTFGQKKGGADFLMCRSVSPTVRSINFRREDPDDIPKGYNIQIWHGEKMLHHGLHEFLRSRHTSDR